MQKHPNIINLIFVLLLLNIYSCTSQNNPSEVYNLMPWPKTLEKTNTNHSINKDLTISIHGKDSHKRVHNASVSFIRRLTKRTGIFIDKGFPLKNDNGSIQVHFTNTAALKITDDESYHLSVENNYIKVEAKTDVGALHGLQTLLQLITHNDTQYYFPGVEIKDNPRFVWRGLMIDAARHFQPVDVIKRNLDAMASVKLNVLHWHLTDDQGFRVESKTFPKLHEIGGDGLYYTQEQVKDVVKYAANLGIRVIPEFDVPGHASAILAAYPELSSKKDYEYSVERFAGVFDPTLNPTKDITYEFLDKLFSEMAPLFPDDYFHIGGDENEGKHWDSNPNIQTFKKDHGLNTNHDLQTYFNIKLEKILNKLGKKLMGWDEIMTEGMPTTAVIHSWRGENEGFSKGGTLIEAAKKGYRSVLSAGFYIDRMLSVEHHYSVEPIGNATLTKEERARILGGETTMWSELVTPLTIDSRIWPRTAAIAERFWSAKEVTNIDHMRTRLRDVSYELEELGIMHLRNRDVILRGMTNNQDISALVDLVKICEPLKVYSRNEGGTEYTSYSPFNLFADACVVDAEDAVLFKTMVAEFLEKENTNTLNDIMEFLSKWSTNHQRFSKITMNSKIQPLKELSEHLSEASKILSEALSKKQISMTSLNILNNHLDVLKKPYVDVELAIVKPLSIITNYCKEKYLLK